MFPENVLYFLRLRWCNGINSNPLSYQWRKRIPAYTQSDASIVFITHGIIPSNFSAIVRQNLMIAWTWRHHHQHAYPLPCRRRRWLQWQAKDVKDQSSFTGRVIASSNFSCVASFKVNPCCSSPKVTSSSPEIVADCCLGEQLYIDKLYCDSYCVESTFLLQCVAYFRLKGEVRI